MTPAAPPHPPPWLLRRSLPWRLGAACLALLVALAWNDWRDWRAQLAADLPATAELAAQLLRDELAGRAGAFNRPQLTATLAPLAPLARRAAFCAELRNLQGRLMDRGCLPREPPVSTTGQLNPPTDFGLVLAGPEPAPPTWLLPARLARWLAGDTLAQAPAQHTLVLPEGLKLGTLELHPDWTHEAQQLGHRWAVLALACAALLGGLLWIARQSTRQWEATRQQQRQLAGHLLNAREQERRRLARELHDELGQSLAALHAEAAVVELLSAAPPAAPPAAAPPPTDGEPPGPTPLASPVPPALHQSAQAMRRLLGQMQEGLQRVLADLRPQALDRFGLPSALHALVAQPRRHADGSTLHSVLHLPEAWQNLPVDHDIHVYRIVQEALTNAWRHGGAHQVEVALAFEEGHLLLNIQDDGRATPQQPLSPGHGLLGLHERVAALGGTLHWTHPPEGGLHLSVCLPLHDEPSRSPHPDLPEETGP